MDLEHKVIGITFAVCAAAFFLGAVPVYAWRYGSADRPPPLPRGKVSTQGFGMLDVLGVSVIFGWYALSWYAVVWSARNGTGKTELSEMENLSQALTTNLFLQILMIVAVVAFLGRRVNIVHAFGLRWRRWYWALLIAPLAVFVMYSFMGVLEMGFGYSEWVAELQGKKPEETMQDSVRVFQERNDVATIVLMVVIACVGAPLSEEIIFRGYIYGAMKRFTNIPVAVCFSGLLFGAVHLNMSALLPLVVLGLLLAVLYEVTGSLWMPIAVHFVFNAVTVGYQLYARLHPEWLEETRKNAAIIGIW